MFRFFGFVWGLAGLAITATAAIVAFAMTREYVRGRLRFVDGVRNPVVPWVVGFGAALIAMPVVALLGFLHLVSGGTALVFGAFAGLGTASGVKALKRGE